MSFQLTTYQANDGQGNVTFVSAYTESEARQKAEEVLGAGQVVELSVC